MSVRDYLREKLSPGQKAFIADCRKILNPSYYVKKIFWRSLNSKKTQSLLGGPHLKLHLGCNYTRLPGFTNVDIRMTPAVDITCDLNILPFKEGSADCIYSNAFFEHIYRLKRIAHLQSIFHCLDKKAGFVCYTGMPYFKNVARLYLEKGPGTAGPVFDLYNVYRYTHGDPDRMPDWYLEQLHKSLFDEDELAEILRKSGFKNFVIFCYAFPGDANEVSVTMGFFTAKAEKSQEQLKTECLNFIKQFDGRYLILKTLQFLNPSV